MAVKDWDTTAANNDDADATINWLEGQAPSSVNDSARAMMAAIASWYLLIDAGTVSGGTVGGTADAITVTNSPTVGAYAAGQRYLFRAGSANTGAVTIAIDGLAATALRWHDTALVADDIAAGDLVLCVYDGSTTRFQMLNPPRVSLVTTAATQAQQETGTNVINPVTPGRQHFHDSAVKAWMAFDGTGTPTATDVYNFATGASGITDNGAGDYTLAFTTALSTAAGYAIAGMCNQPSAGNSSANHFNVRGTDASVVLGASCRFNTGNCNTGTPTDENYNGVMFAGDI